MAGRAPAVGKARDGASYQSSAGRRKGHVPAGGCSQLLQTETPVCGLPGLSGGKAELRNSVDGGVCCPRGQTPVSQLRAGLGAMPDLPDTPLARGGGSVTSSRRV